MHVVRRVLPCAALIVVTSCTVERAPARDSASAYVAPASNVGAPTPPNTRASSIDTTLSWRTISFHVVVHGDTLTIHPSGLAIDNRQIDETIAGSPVKAEIGDLNKDTWPELLVYLASADTTRRGEVVGYSSNAGKSVSQLYVPGITNDPSANTGYAGHDDFAIVDGTLVRRFPIHDGQGRPTGKTRRIQYKLVEGEAARGLKIDKVTEY